MTRPRRSPAPLLPSLAALVALAVFVALLAPASPAAAQARVAAVTFAPADRVGPYRYRDLVAVRPGDPLVPELLERNLRLLHASGLFAQVEGGLVDGPEGPIVRFTLQPHPLVGEVRIKGNFLVLERDLSAILRLREAEPFRTEIVKSDIERILRHYEEQGYEGTTVADDVSHRDGEVRVVYRIDEGRPRVVREVRARGNRDVSDEEVLAAFGVARFRFFRGADLQRGLDKLRDFYQRRGYLDVRVGSEITGVGGRLGFLAVLTNPIKGLLTLGPGGYRLIAVTLVIEEGRRYEASFRGLSAFGEKDLRPLLTFQRTGFFDEEEVAAGRENILAYYQERGYYLAEVETQADYETGRVVYAVRENRPVAVAEVRLRGFTHFTEAWVRGQLQVRPSAGETVRLLRASQIERDRRAIQAWYRDAGFTRAEVPPVEVWPEGDAGGAVVVYAVNEGPRSLLRYVSFAGVAGVPVARLRAAAGLREGQPYRAIDLQPAADRVRAVYERAGYPRCVVTVRPDFGEGRAAVDLRFTVEEGRPRRLGAVAVTGNGRTDRHVIVRELPLESGDPLDPQQLATGKTRLYDLGLFREVRYVLPDPVSPEAPQDLVLAVRERPTGFVGFGAGYASDERFRGFVEAGEQNLLGTGRGLRWKSKLSTIGYRHDLFYQEPWVLDYRLKGQADLYLERRDENGYDLLRRGLTLGVNREVRPRLVLTLRYRYEFVNYSNVVPDLTEELGPLESFNIGSAFAQLDYDLRDNPISPHRGSFHLASVEVARPIFGGNASFTKYQLETSWYLPLGPGAELAVGLRGGFTALLLGSEDLPLSERFFLGGDRTVRGYAYKEIGPKDDAGTSLGGTMFALGNVELRFDLVGKLRGVLFLDAGELSSDQPGQPSSGLRSSAGAGLRYETLVGPIRLDWGRKLRPEENSASSRWHLTIGYPF